MGIGARRGAAALTLSARAAQAFHNYIKLILLRKNTINGVVYSEDPTIMAVELANEPHTRCAVPRCRLGETLRQACVQCKGCSQSWCSACQPPCVLRPWQPRRRVTVVPSKEAVM